MKLSVSAFSEPFKDGQSSILWKFDYNKWEYTSKHAMFSYLWNLCLITIVEDTVDLLGLKVFNSDNSYIIFCCKNTTSYFCKEYAIENYLFLKILNIDIEGF